MRPLLAIVLTLALTGPAIGATRTWPGPAPCATTLQACISASAAGDVVLVATDSPIDEALAIDTSLTLAPAPGFRPRLAPGRSIQSAFNTGVQTLAIEGMQLTDGAITVTNGSIGGATIRLRGNRMESTGSAWSRLSVRKSNANGTLDVDISENTVVSPASIGSRSLVDVSSNGTTQGTIAFNQLRAPGDNAGRGIRADLSPGAAHTLRVFANQVDGNFAEGSIRLTTGVDNFGSAGTSEGRLFAVGNAVTCRWRAGLVAEGLLVQPNINREVELRVFNNTIVGCGNSLTVSAPGGGPYTTLRGGVSNNLIAFNDTTAFIVSSVLAQFSLTRNLSHGNTVNGMPPGASNTITGNPRLYSTGAPRLLPGSPAINAGEAVAAQLIHAIAGLPQVDADGRRRTIGTGTTAIDIGAFEAGDLTTLAIKPGAAGSTFDLGLGALPDTLPVHVTKTFNPVGAGVDNPEPAGVLHLASWQGYAVTTPPTLPQGVALNVFAPGAQGSFGAAYSHTTSAANTVNESTSLSTTYLNGVNPSQAIVLATPRWLGGPQNPRNTAVAYGCGVATGANCWQVTQLELAPMPANFGFNIYAQDRSPNAFVHRAEPGNTSGNGTRFGHPLLAQDPRRCARPIVVAKAGGVAPNRSFDVTWDASRSGWLIYAYGAGSIPVGAEWYVFVDARQVFECNDAIFADGFQQ